MIQAVSTLVAGFVAFRWIDPADMGLWVVVQSFQVWSDVFRFGIPNGLTRQISFHLGRDDRAAAESTVATAELATRWSMGVGGVVFCVLSQPLWARGASWRMAIAASLIGWLANAYSGYLQASFRSNSDFGKLSRILVLDAVVGVGLLALVPTHGFFGICLRGAIQPVVQAGALHLARPFPRQAVMDRARLHEILAIGLPLFGGGYLLQVANNAERVLMARHHVPDAVIGLFAPAQTIQSAMLLLPSTLLTYAYPKLSLAYARSASPRALCHKALLGALASVAGCAALAVPAWFLVGALVPVLFPKFAGSVSSMQFALAAAVLMAVRPATAVFPVLRAWRAYYAWVLVLLVSKWGLCSLLIPRMDPLDAVNRANVASSGITALAILACTYQAARESESKAGS